MEFFCLSVQSFWRETRYILERGSYVVNTVELLSLMGVLGYGNTHIVRRVSTFLSVVNFLVFLIRQACWETYWRSETAGIRYKNSEYQSRISADAISTVKSSWLTSQDKWSNGELNVVVSEVLILTEAGKSNMLEKSLARADSGWKGMLIAEYGCWKTG